MNNINFGILTFVLIFYIYSFFGWCFESAYVSLKSGKAVNRGFMKGPFLPIYGFGGVAILFSTTPFMSDPVLVYIASVFTATLLELVTGIVMEALFKVRYWDYSNNFLNYRGYICLKSSIAWGFMGVLVAYVINEPFAEAIESLPISFILPVTALISFVFVYDFAQSFRTAFGLRTVVIESEKLMSELKEIRNGFEEAIERERTKAEERRRALASEFREKLDRAFTYTEADEYIMSKLEELKSLSIEDKLAHWRSRNVELKNAIMSLDSKKLSLIKRNPSARSHTGILNEIREYRKRNEK